MTPFDVVLVPFPFADLSATKQRPCLVLASFKPRGLNEHVIVAMMTSHISGLGFPHDVSLVDWQKAGLPKPTLVRLTKVVTLDRTIVKRKLGRLLRADQQTIMARFKDLFFPLLS
jgi:mRNA interferase MazF